MVDTAIIRILLQTVQDWGLISLALLLSLAIFAMPQVYAQQPQPLVGTCLSDSQCDIVTLTNGTLVDNPYNPSLLITKAPIPQAETCTGNCPLADAEVIAPFQGQLIIEEETEVISNDNNDDDEAAEDSGRPPSDNPYCDQVSVYNDCFDRKDYDQETGLYPCKDGSDVEDWRDCNGDSNSNNNDSAAEDEPAQDGGCQSEDTYCDADENCRSESVDCIDDRNFDEDDYNG